MLEQTRMTGTSSGVVIAAATLLATVGVGCGKTSDETSHKADETSYKADESEKNVESKAATTSKTTPAPAGVTVSAGSLAAFAPLPEVMAGKDRLLSPKRVELGRELYYDTRLSKNHDVSCNSCHLLDKFGVDGKPVAVGHKGLKGPRNSPTVYNAAGHFAQFWDGRAADVEAQAKGPVLAPVEMAMPNEASVVRVLASIPGYVEQFKAAFPDDKKPLTYENMSVAIGAFERKLVTPAPWDAFLGGDKSALSDAQKKGFNTFVAVGCPTCHSGPYLGGHMFQKLGLAKPWPDDSDLGRFAVTKNDADKMMFKVPSLRNIARTGPYFHNGAVSELGDAVRTMAEYQLGRTLTDQQVTSILTFFSALTGEIPAAYIAKPKLPPSGPKTPKPDPS